MISVDKIKKTLFRYGDKRDLPNLFRVAAFAIIVIMFCVFYFNLMRFNWNASYSEATIKKNLKAVSEHDYQDVKTVEKSIKLAESHDMTGTLNVKRKSSVYYIKKFKHSVILGDSVTEGLSVYGYLSEDQVFCAIGASLLGSKDLFKKAAKTYPEHAFFSFGMNDLITYRGEVKPFIKQYRKLLKLFIKKSPDSEIYINSISVPNKDARNRQKSLAHYKDYNKALEKLCEDEGFVFIDNTYILKKNPSLYAGDGIHVSTTYYPIWLDDMITEADL